MKHRKKVEWTRLDNAAKIFPPTSNNKDTKVFRFVCELLEPVEPVILQQALDKTIEYFPWYKSVLRRGAFWYYFESSNIRPIVDMESEPVCGRIYYENRRSLLFRVVYYKNRINFEAFHALSDGAGALWFLKTLIYYYLIYRHEDELKDSIPKLDYSASKSQKMDDSFKKYYTGKIHRKREFIDKAYKIHGTKRDEYRMLIIEGSMSAKAVLKAAHEYDTSLTVYLTALLMYSIYKGMSEKKKKHPVVLSVPVNMRNFFESESARNFFSTINIAYNFSKNSTDFSDIVQSVSDSFKRELEEERIKGHMERLIALEQNALIRIVPLPIKNIILRLSDRRNERGITSSISNVGKIGLPDELHSYIKHFAVYTSARRPQITLCSYGDILTISFSSPLVETDIQKTFFKTLTEKGINVEIVSN
ncbi:MAG: hypothetical protein K0R92_155 [Lachnospiraceae bacterium]|jgi:NRPS condensation-like uncharacterized protein|nr:hypothetical protein [Lachnospiraceae bacterium]